MTSWERFSMNSKSDPPGTMGAISGMSDRYLETLEAISGSNPMASRMSGSSADVRVVNARRRAFSAALWTDAS